MNTVSIAGNMVALSATSKLALAIAVLLFGMLCIYKLIVSERFLSMLVGVLLLVGAAYLLTGCTPGSEVTSNGASQINTWHDDQRSVTCWIYTDAMHQSDSISCLPDKELSR